MENIGRVINNKYEIERIVGKGGMSVIYLANDRNINGKYWKIKFISYKDIKDQKAKRQLKIFENEVDLLSTFNHPSIPRIVDSIRIDDELYVCMDYINGCSLFEEFKQQGVFTEEKLIDLTIQLCDILIYLHEVRENPIVYSDIKLENVMLEHGRVKLMDFGIAKECVRGVNISDKVGTKGYAAPEQYKGLALDERTDIYAVGAMLYRLITGIAPQCHPHEFPPIVTINSKCSEGLAYIIHRCIEEDPNQRYKNCHELKNDLINIEKLNSSYRKKMQSKLIKFASCIAVLSVFITMTTFGYSGMVEANRDKYKEYMDKATTYQKSGEFEQAEKSFIDATEYSPKSTEPYLQLLDMYRLKEGNREELIKESILAVERLVEDKKSKVYNNPEIIYRLAKLCFEIKSDTNYAVKAYNYFERVKKSNVYEEAEIDSYLTIAYYDKMIFNSEEDYLTLAESLQTLEDYTDKINNIDTRLDNYYTLTTIYNSYLNESVLNSKDKIISISNKALELIANTPEDTFEFTDEIILIERVATAYYTKGINETEQLLKREYLEQSLAYFLQLEEMGVELSESIQLRIGNIYRGLYETYTFEERSTVKHFLSKACEKYEALIKQNDQHLEASVKLTDTYLDLELLNNDSNQRNFTKAIKQYQKTASIADANKSASFRALKQRMISYGL